MSVTEIVNLIVNNGACIGCLVYFMYYNSKQLDNLTKTLAELKDVINSLKNKED